MTSKRIEKINLKLSVLETTITQLHEQIKQLEIKILALEQPESVFATNFSPIIQVLPLPYTPSEKDINIEDFNFAMKKALSYDMLI